MEFSIQKIFLGIFISFILGVGGAFLFKGNIVFYLLLLTAFLLFFILSKFDRRLFFVGIFILSFLVGFIRVDLYYHNQKNITQKTIKFEFIEKIRLKIDSAINQYFFPPESEFVKGLILGQDSISDKNFKNQLNKTGMRHIVAVSGFNMAILAVFLYAIVSLFGFSRKTIFIFLILFLFFYTIFVNAPPSAIRALIMVLVALGINLLFSQARTLNSLVITAAIMIFQNPEILIKDIGFQFSFLAVLGIILFNEPIEAILKKLKIPNIVASVFSLSISAQILLIPLMAFYFKGFSIVSPILNSIVIPLSSLLLMIGLFFSLFLFFIPYLSIILIYPMNLIASAIVFLIQFFAQLPFGYIFFNLQNDFTLVIIYYFIILLSFKYFQKLKLL